MAKERREKLTLRGWLQPAALASILLLVIVPLGVLSYATRHQQLDDALIYQRYIANALEGEGLVYNGGERVNGLTSPLFAYLLLIGAVLTRGDVQLAAVLVSIFSTLLAALSVMMLTVWARQSVSLAAPVAGAFLLVTSRFTYINFGMEAMLFSGLLGLGLLAFLAQKRTTAGSLLGLAWLARPETVFMLGAITLISLWRDRKLPVREIVISVGIYLSQGVLNVLYYGTFLSSSATAKMYQGRSGAWATQFLDYGFGQLHLIFGGAWLAFLWVLGLGFLGLLVCRRADLRTAAVVFLGSYTLFFLYFRFPPQIWYYGPYYVLGWVFVATGLFWIIDWLQTVSTTGVRAVLLVCLGLSLGGVGLHSALHTYRFSAGAIRPDYRDMGIWLRRNTQPEAKVAAVEIGTLGWYSDRYIVDILGLVSPPNAEFVGRGDFDSWLEHYDPDYVLVHDPPWPYELGAIRREEVGGFVSVVAFPFDGVRLLSRP